MSEIEIVNAINDHDELAASFEGTIITVSKVDDHSIGNELIADYINRIVDHDVMKMLKTVSVDEAASVAIYELA